MKRASMVVLVTLAAGCGGVPQPTPDYFIDGVGIAIDPSAPAWTAAPDFDDRVAFLVRTAAEYAGGDYRSVRGWVIRFSATGSVGVNREGMLLAGATHDGWIDIAVGDHSSGDCMGTDRCYVENTALVHEIVHAVIGDGCHEAALWRDFAGPAAAINARGLTYQDPILGLVPVHVDPAMWRLAAGVC